MVPVIPSAVPCARLVLGLLCLIAIARPVCAGFVTFSVGGNTTAASIQATVDVFRAALGDPNNSSNPGPLVGGRREINWDGGGSPVASPVGTPMTTFQNIRGATFTTPGTGFLQTPLDVVDLSNINPTYPTTFGTFSILRVFTPIGSNITDATFSLPGSGGGILATVAGFGAVFSDVDSATSTGIEFFDVDGNSIFSAFAPPATVTDAGLSFIGVLANAGERIARVRLTTGNFALGPNDQNGNVVDVVVMDDFLFAEPVAVPEPTSLALAAVGFFAVVTLAGRRRHCPHCRRSPWESRSPAQEGRENAHRNKNEHGESAVVGSRKVSEALAMFTPACVGSEQRAPQARPRLARGRTARGQR